MKDKPRIALCIHLYNNIDSTIYFNHMSCIRKWSKDYDVVILGRRGMQTAPAREIIVEEALAQKCDFAFFLDGDHMMPLKTFELLLEGSDDYAMCSGLVNMKCGDYRPVYWLKNNEGEGYITPKLSLDGRRYEVDLCAFGCTMVNLNKIQKLEKDYFRDIYISEGRHRRSDINLCMAFREIGEKIYVDTRVLVGHMRLPSFVYPQSAPQLPSLDLLEENSRKLSDGQVGFFDDMYIR
jgi:hypothetical protein